MKTDEEILALNAHIPDEEVLRDIKDTEAEILLRRRLNYDQPGIAKRQEFIERLRHLLDLRNRP
jgi:hypothetical protein